MDGYKMTKRRNYNARCEQCGVDALCPVCGNPVSSATPFSDWLRDQAELDSAKGYVATNIDYVWSNHQSGRWIFLEEKRYGGIPTASQREQFAKLDQSAEGVPGYGGFWILTFSATTPDDGKIWLYRLGEPGGEVSKEELITFLQDCGR